MLTYGSLFTGIGGIDLGLDRAGWECRWQVESNPHAGAILADHWPAVRRHGDIHAVDPTELERVDLVCGGFPCQPTSVAGNRRGDKDDRWLWPEFARILGGVRPRWALLENPPGLLSFREFGDVLGDLAGLGFDAEWDSFPAAAFGAPHIRDRVFVVAYAVSNELRDEQGRLRPQRPEGLVTERQGAAVARDDGTARSVADSEWAGWWEVEPNVGRVADGVPARVDRLTRLGNAVVPQVAEFVGRAIIAAHNGEAA